MTQPICMASRLVAAVSTINPAHHHRASHFLRRALRLTIDPAIRKRIGDLADAWATHTWQADRAVGHDFYHVAQRGWGKVTCSACRKPLEELQ